MADVRLAYDLLMAENFDEMNRLALELNRLNTKRQHIEEKILKEIRQRYSEEDSRRHTFVMGAQDWPDGLIGIVASKVQQEIHYGPAIIFSLDEEKGIARGSARSVSGFDIYKALKRCDDILIRWGGHKMAAGLSVTLDRLEAFRNRFEELAQEYSPEVFVPRGRVDMRMSLALITPELFNTLRQLEPHGLGNPIPVFAAPKAKVNIRKAFGRDHSHLRLSLEDRLEAIFWRGHQRYRSGEWMDGERLDVIFQLEWSSFNDKPVLTVKDLGHFF